MRLVALGLVAFVLTGCAATSGVLKMGPDTYQISSHYAPVRGGIDAAKSDVLNKAAAFCINQSKELLVKNSRNLFSQRANAYTGFEATFQCLDKNDHNLARPNYKQSPDIVIQTQSE